MPETRFVPVGDKKIQVMVGGQGPPRVVVVAVHDLGRAGVAWTAFAPHAGTFTRAPAPLGPTRIDAIEECVRRAPVGAAWCGDLGEPLRAAIAGVGGIAVGADTAAQSGDTGARAALDAVDVVRLARARHAYGDAAAVDVTYLRPPSIGARRALG